MLPRCETISYNIMILPFSFQAEAAVGRNFMRVPDGGLIY